MRLRIGTATLTVLLLLIPLDACNEDLSDTDLGTSSNTSQPSSGDPSPSETGPTIPPKAQGTDLASAKAFVKFFLATLNQAMQTGNTLYVASLTTQACANCQVLLSNLDDSFTHDGTVTTDGWSVQRMTAKLDTPRKKSLFLRVKMAQTDFYDAEGKRTRRDPAQTSPVQMILVRRSSEWRINALVVLL